MSVMKYLKCAIEAKDRTRLLRVPACSEQLKDGRIALTDCTRISHERNLTTLQKSMSRTPMLIVEKNGDEERIVGILDRHLICCRERADPLFSDLTPRKDRR